jgi:Gluconate 2-dehydrogenase subunit 3
MRSAPGQDTFAQATEPLEPREQPGYYPGYSTLGQKGYWDEATRKTVLTRVEDVLPLRFFGPEEAVFWNVVFEHLIPQSDRIRESRVPVLNYVDHRLDVNQSQGYRYENMLPDREAYRLGMKAINDESISRCQCEFVECSYGQRETILKTIHGGEPTAAKDIWKRMSVHRFWQLIMGDAVEAYYAHPWAWDEIGYGGPAYPRGYMRLEDGQPEPWEVDEQRYTWDVPEGTLSDDTEDVREHSIESLQHMSHQKRRRTE